VLYPATPRIRCPGGNHGVHTRNQLSASHGGGHPVLYPPLTVGWWSWWIITPKLIRHAPPSTLALPRARACQNAGHKIGVDKRCQRAAGSAGDRVDFDHSGSTTDLVGFVVAVIGREVCSPETVDTVGLNVLRKRSEPVEAGREMRGAFHADGHGGQLIDARVRDRRLAADELGGVVRTPSEPTGALSSPENRQ
jgi:hypothetical protein